MNNHDKIKQAFDGLKAPGNMAEKILANTESKTMRAPRRNNRLIQIALVAIISVFMTVTVFAVVAPEMISEVLSGRLFVRETDNPEYPVKITTEMTAYPFSEKLREYIQNNEGGPLNEGEPLHEYLLRYDIMFDSFEEISDFFDVPISSFGHIPNLNMFNEDGTKANVFSIRCVMVVYPEKDSAYVHFSATVSLEAEKKFDELSFVVLMACFDINGWSDSYPFGKPFEYVIFIRPEDNLKEIYTSPVNGIEAAIYTRPVLGPIIMFSIDDILYEITLTPALYNKYDNIDECVELFKNLVDSIK